MYNSAWMLANESLLPAVSCMLKYNELSRLAKANVWAVLLGTQCWFLIWVSLIKLSVEDVDSLVATGLRDVEAALPLCCPVRPPDLQGHTSALVSGGPCCGITSLFSITWRCATSGFYNSIQSQYSYNWKFCYVHIWFFFPLKKCWNNQAVSFSPVQQNETAV